jgi:predicted nucleic acid-binding protein
MSRAVARVDTALVEVVDVILSGLVLLDIDDALLRRAAAIRPAHLRSLDAIHLSSAERLGPDLDVFVAYDDRLLQAARALGLAVASPGSPPTGAVP